MKLWILAGAAVGVIVLAFVPAAAPAGCATITRSYTPYIAPTYTPYVAPYVAPYVKPEYIPVAVYQAFPVFVPTFTVGYQPPAPFPGYPTAAPPTASAPPSQAGAAPAPPPAVTSGGMAEVLAELRRLNGRMDAMERGQSLPAPRAATAEPPPPAVPAAPRNGAALALFNAKCAACHKAGNESKGKGFIMLDASGNFVPSLTTAQWERMGAKMTFGKMPPKDSGITLSDEEGTAMMEEVSRHLGEAIAAPANGAGK
jgi:mono/diheme cytochrome c family protein